MSITFSPQGIMSQDDVNMSNSNAGLIMKFLGIAFDYCGNIQSDELIERIDSAPSSIGGFVRKPSVDKTPGHATMICCGADEEYIKRRLENLRNLAVQHPGVIVWC